MSRFSIDTSQIDQIQLRLSIESFLLSHIGNSLSELSDDVNFGSRQDADIRQALQSVAGKVKKNATGIAALSDGLLQVTRNYDMAEMKVIMSHFTFPVIPWLNRKKWFENIISPIGVGAIISTASAVSAKTKAGGKKKDRQYDHEVKVIWDSEKQKWVKKEKANKDPEWDVTIYGKEWKTSDSAWSGTLSTEGDGVETSMELDLWKKTSKAGFYVGSAGAGAYAGASVTALHFEEEIKAGGENLNVYAKGEVDVGRAGAEAKIKAGFDGEGKFNANAGFTAEAIAGEASIKGGANIGGVDVSAKASVNYGIGVKGNVGLDGGKLKIEFGATLGVGVGVNLEIDVSKAVDTVCEVGEAIVGGAVSAVETFGSAVGDGISAIGKGIGKLFSWW